MTKHNIYATFQRVMFYHITVPTIWNYRIQLCVYDLFPPPRLPKQDCKTQERQGFINLFHHSKLWSHKAEQIVAWWIRLFFGKYSLPPSPTSMGGRYVIEVLWVCAEMRVWCQFQNQARLRLFLPAPPRKFDFCHKEPVPRSPLPPPAWAPAGDIQNRAPPPICRPESVRINTLRWKPEF